MTFVRKLSRCWSLIFRRFCGCSKHGTTILESESGHGQKPRPEPGDRRHSSFWAEVKDRQVKPPLHLACRRRKVIVWLFGKALAPKQLASLLDAHLKAQQHCHCRNAHSTSVPQSA